MRWQFDDDGIDWKELSELYRIAPLGDKCAEQEAQADDAIADDHHGCENGVAGQRARCLAARKHQRDDQRGLDGRDCEREDQRAERLADPERDDLGMMHSHENRGDQCNEDEREECPAERAVPDRDQHCAAGDR